jgi:hypothetical protein
VGGIAVCLLAFAAGMGLWLYNQHTGKIRRPAAIAQATQPNAPMAPTAPLVAPQPSPPVIAAQERPVEPTVRRATEPGPCYVHRNGSDLRDKPKTSGHVLKKEAKGAKLTLVSLEDGGWAKVRDGDLTGYMRASVLGADPPAE